MAIDAAACITVTAMVGEASVPCLPCAGWALTAMLLYSSMLCGPQVRLLSWTLQKPEGEGEGERGAWSREVVALLYPLTKRSYVISRHLAAHLSTLAHLLTTTDDPLTLSVGAQHHARDHSPCPNPKPSSAPLTCTKLHIREDVRLLVLHQLQFKLDSVFRHRVECGPGLDILEEMLSSGDHRHAASQMANEGIVAALVRPLPDVRVRLRMCVHGCVGV